MTLSYDSLKKVADFARVKGITFPLVSDEDQALLSRYGLRTEEGYSVPGTYLLGDQGGVRAEFFLDGYRKRHPSEDLLNAYRSLSG